MARALSKKRTKRRVLSLTSEDRAALRDVRQAIDRGEADVALTEPQLAAILRERKQRAG